MSTNFESRIKKYIDKFQPVSLSDMDSVKLMKRTDTKFVFHSEKLGSVLESLKDEYSMLEINGERAQKYDTVYYDTNDFEMYSRHHSGKLNRYKIRFRRYLVSGIGFLEVKYKNNKGQTIKKREKAQDRHTFNGEIKEFLRNNTPYGLDEIEAKLRVKFTRLTLVNKAFTERVTLDYGLTYENYETKEIEDLSGVSIIEVKKDVYSQNTQITDVLKKHKIYPMGFSKYCIGTAMLNRQIKRNMFKEKLIFVKNIDEKFLIA